MWGILEIHPPMGGCLCIHIKLVKISKGSHSNFSEIDQKVYYKLKSIKCLFNKMYGNYNNSGRPFSILSLTPIPSKIQSCLWKNNYLVYFLSFFFFFLPNSKLSPVIHWFHMTYFFLIRIIIFFNLFLFLAALGFLCCVCFLYLRPVGPFLSGGFSCCGEHGLGHWGFSGCGAQA